MKQIKLLHQDIYAGNLLLVNRAQPLMQLPRGPLTPAVPSFPHVLLSRGAANALQLLLEKLGDGDWIVPVSGYRSKEEQTALYDQALLDHGPDFVRKFVARPDCSEHQTGLAVDLGHRGGEMDFLCPDFPYDGICQRFRDLAPDYGFIQRYTAEKEEQTGIAHEPWHFRYVGFPHSKIMAEEGLCLEEYMGFIKNYRAETRLIYRQDRQTQIQVFYLPAQEGETWACLPDSVPYQISGNNVDGFIVTIWRKNYGT